MRRPANLCLKKGWSCRRINASGRGRTCLASSGVLREQHSCAFDLNFRLRRCPEAPPALAEQISPTARLDSASRHFAGLCDRLQRRITIGTTAGIELTERAV